VYHLNSPFRPKAASFAAPGQTPESNSVTVTGRVVDAACFMMHAAAATMASHRDCGAACLARGVPLAIATDDGVLYFPADGNGSPRRRRLQTDHHPNTREDFAGNARTRVSLDLDRCVRGPSIRPAHQRRAARDSVHLGLVTVYDQKNL